jgi:hypothetical protein
VVFGLFRPEFLEKAKVGKVPRDALCHGNNARAATASLVRVVNAHLQQVEHVALKRHGDHDGQDGGVVLVGEGVGVDDSHGIPLSV